jgi:hypothetical protein
MNKNKLIFYSLILAVSLLFLAFSGCGANTVTTSKPVTNTDSTVITYTPVNNTNGEEYSSFSATGIPPFSFEYPVEYIVKSYQTMPDFPSTNLILIPSTELHQTINTSVITTVTPYQTIITVTTLPPDFVFDLNDYNIILIYIAYHVKPADMAVDETTVELKRLETEGHIDNLRVVYKKQVVVGGIQGWEVKHSLTDYPQNALGIDRTKPTSMISRDIYFDYKDMSFNISLFSDATIIDETEKAYEHILQTFKLLE